jgi:3'-phosphoadenosine 5'-phosphosulfate sulfotransferase (PAPS reductase)/FAD synthetase
MENKGTIICWWSGGVTSAVACKIAIDLYGEERCRVVMIDTQNEHYDTYRFKDDCEKWYNKPIEIITGIGETYKNIEDVWVKHKSLNVATGAICSTQLKRRVNQQFNKN